MKIRKLLVLVLGLSAPLSVVTAETGGDSEDTRPVVMDRLVVAGTAAGAGEIGGSVQILDEELLDTWRYSDINRILRQVPGVYLQEEDGYGLRPNIGIRGSGSDRSSRVAILEDGILMAPAPYAAPAAYYFPTPGRIQAAEVVKGPASIQYGPQTVGGAIHFHSTPVPGVPGSGLGGRLDAYSGSHDRRRAHGVLGGWLDEPIAGHDVGIMVETWQDATRGFKRLGRGGDTGYRIDDYVAKLRLEARPDAAIDQSLEFKVQSSNETSNETYLGLSLDDFRADPFRRYHASQRDVMEVDHRTLQATHRIELGGGFDLTTVAYRTDTGRAWYKLHDVRDADGNTIGLDAVLADPATYANEYAALVGAAGETSAPGALRVRNNARDYYSQGIQTILGKSFLTGPARHQLEASVRWHRDEEDRFQNDDRYTMVNGTMVLDEGGAPGSQDNRVGAAEAWSLYVRDTIAWGDWTFTPGIRYENVDLTRTDYATTDPGRAAGPTSIRENSVDIWIPGAGLTWQATPSLQWLAGVHRGFANPGPGSAADNETSWNYEAGLRWFRGLLALEAIGFYSDYSNLVGTCTASTGGDCTIGEQFDGGAAEVSGLELTAWYDAAGLFDLQRVGIPLSVVYTFTRAEFGTSFASGLGTWGEVTAGDELPYVPAHQLTVTAGLSASNWRSHLSINYVDETRSQAGSGAIPAEQRIDGRVLLDLTAEIDVARQASVFIGVDNLTDEVYNAAFSPAGARPGKPRTYMAGLKTTF